MISNVRCAVAALLFWSACALAWAGPFDRELPDTPAPPGSQWYWVGRHMVVDGLPMSVKLFTYGGDEADMEAHFNSVWRNQGHGKFFKRRMGDAIILGHSTPDKYTTVQYRKVEGAIEGKIVVTPSPLDRREKPRPGVPIPPGAKIMNHILSRDGSQSFETLVLQAKANVRSSTRYYQRQLESRGWTPVFVKAEATVYSGQYQSSDGLMKVTISEMPGTNARQSRIQIHLIHQ